MKFPMNKIISSIWVLFLVWTLLPETSGATITIDSIGRTGNTLKLKPEEPDSATEKRFNLRDCLDNIKLTISFTEQSAGKGSLYLIAGESCDQKDDNLSESCVVIDEMVNNKKVNLREILEIENADGCRSETTGSISLWVARLEEVDTERVITEAWSADWTLSWDMKPPEPPNITGTGVGEKKVVIKWATDDNDAGAGDDGLASDAKEVRVLYMAGAAESGSADDAGMDEADTAAADMDTATLGVCPTGGFSEGDAYIPDQYDESGEVLLPSAGEGEVSGLTNGVTYKLGAVVLDEFNNASTISETVCATPNPSDDFADSYTDAGGKVGKFCFVATAAFGSYDHPMVQLLRRFRDQFLAPIPGGQTVIDGYYRVGPSIAAFVEGNAALKIAAEGALSVLAISTVPLSALGPLGTLLIGLFALSFFVVRRKLK